jgi:O-antigen ligase
VRSALRIAAPWALPAAILLIGTALGVAHSVASFGPERGRAAAELWVPGIGGGLTVLFVAALVALSGERRPMLIVAASVTTAALLSMLDLWAGGAVNASALGWLLHDQVDTSRMAGIILAPNAAAAIYLVGLAVSVASAIHTADRRVRALALAAALACGLAVALTFSRSAMLAAVVGAIILGWHWRGWRGAAIATGAAATAALVLLVVSPDAIRDVPQMADQRRIEAWRGAVLMWRDEPLLGHGFRSFEWLHRPPYQSILDAPHNEWLRFFAEEGLIVGLAGLVFAVTAPLTALRTRASYATAAAASAAGGVFVMACFNNPFLYTQVNVPAFLVIGAGLGATVAGKVTPSAPRTAADAPTAEGAA